MQIIPFLLKPFTGNYPIIFQFGEISQDASLLVKYKEWGLRGHNGIDFGLPQGTEVVACDTGTVIQVGENGDFGISVTLQHPWGTSFSAHLKEARVTLESSVGQGFCIGVSGQSGLAFEPHLHFGIKPNQTDPENGYGGYIDPTPLIVSATELKLQQLKEKLAGYEQKLASKMKRYRGVIHESGLSEMRHNEVMILRAMVTDVKREIQTLESDKISP